MPFARYIGDDAPFNRDTVNGEASNALFHIVRVGDSDVVSSLAEFPGNLKIAESFWDAGIDTQSVISGTDAKDILGNIYKGPGRSTGEPAVFPASEGAGGIREDLSGTG